MKVDLSEIKRSDYIENSTKPSVFVRRGEGVVMPVVLSNTGLMVNIEDIRSNLGKLSEKQRRSILSSNIMKLVLL